jgi:protein-S-isoprenylcysteine O-methyltransferase Ste14
MKPYFQTHSEGWLFLLALIAFFGMEAVQFFRQRGWRRDATRVATPAFWVGVTVWTVLATVMLHRGSEIAPGASIGAGAGVFAAGMALLMAGAALRWSSFWALGQYFTFTVDVSSDQQVVTAGPYRALRHPGYAGGLLATLGIGVVYANWVGVRRAPQAAPAAHLVTGRTTASQSLGPVLDARYAGPEVPPHSSGARSAIDCEKCQWWPPRSSAAYWRSPYG